MSFFDKLKKLVSNNPKETSKYQSGLRETRKTFTQRLTDLSLRYHKIDNDYFDELEEILIMADVGVNTVMEFVDRLKQRVAREGINDPKLLNEIIVDELFIIYVNNATVSTKINYNKEGLTVILFVGVNGVGKTTTIGKIANKMRKDGKKVLLAAGDTFRAGAIDQLGEWAKRSGVDIVKALEKQDPSSVIYDALQEAKSGNYDVLICDTAGRLQNKVNLMNELEKINRVIKREVPDAPHETLLVIDATTGQNGISQAKAFTEATKVSGIVLSKLDGTAKGGIVLAIREIVNIPVKFVTLGEKIDDIEEFDIEQYIYGLFSDLF